MMKTKLVAQFYVQFSRYFFFFLNSSGKSKITINLPSNETNRKRGFIVLLPLKAEIATMSCSEQGLIIDLFVRSVKALRGPSKKSFKVCTEFRNI